MATFEKQEHSGIKNRNGHLFLVQLLWLSCAPGHNNVLVNQDKRGMLGL